MRVSPTWTRGGRERRSRVPGGLHGVNNSLTAAHRSKLQLRRVEVACHVLGRCGQQRFRSEAPQSFTRFDWAVVAVFLTPRHERGTGAPGDDGPWDVPLDALS